MINVNIKPKYTIKMNINISENNVVYIRKNLII